MASSFGDAVLDFDLDFLHQNNDVTVLNKLEKQRKAVLVAKKKTIATDSLIKKYYEKKDVLEQIEKNLFESKEECKQVCIDYRNALQKVTYLEESEQKLRFANQELEERCAFSENRYGALQSHANQLQLLVKDNETKIEAMEIENQLQKSNAKECEKKVSSLEREKEVMLQHILVLKDIVLGKKKLDRRVLDALKKYKGKSEDSGDVSASDCETYDGFIEADETSVSWKNEAFTDCDTQETTKLELELKVLKPDKILKIILDEKIETIDSFPENLDEPKQHKDMDHDSNGSNEIPLSVDTGRGSSLACSDNEKGFHSPNHCNVDTLPNSVAAPSNHSDSVSSHTIPPTVATKSGASIFDDLMESETTTKAETVPETSDHCTLEDIAIGSTQPNLETASETLTFIMDSRSDDIDTNQFEDETNDGFLKPPSQTVFQNTPRSESQCLKFNNSNTILPSDENSSDYEVSTILNKMGLHYSLITPLPQSPTSMSSCSAAENTNIHSCQEAAEIREENKILHASIASLAQQVKEIKSLLSSHCNNLGIGPNTIITDETVQRQTDFPNPVKARECNEVPRGVYSADKEEKEINPNLSSVKEGWRELQTQCEEPSFVGGGRAKNEVITVSDKQMQTQQLFNMDLPQADEVERIINPVCEVAYNNLKAVDELNKDIESNEISEEISKEFLIQLSDLCDDATITNNEEPSELFISDEPVDEFSGTPEITTNNSRTSEGRIAERLLFDESALSDDNGLEAENFHCPEEQGTIINNCDINLKLDVVCNNNHTQKNYKKSKLTKLEKIKKMLQPKNKIKVAEGPKKTTKKLRPRAASNAAHLSGKTELNDKAVYEKALAVVAELRAKQKHKNEKVFVTRSGRVHAKTEFNNKAMDLEQSKQVPAPKILKFRQNPRLVNEDKKDIRTFSKCVPLSASEINSVTTRSRSKAIVNTQRKTRQSSLSEDEQNVIFSDEINGSAINDDTPLKSPGKRSSLKRPCIGISELETKRKLRSFNGRDQVHENPVLSKMDVCRPDNIPVADKQKTVLNNEHEHKTCKDYGDMDMFTETIETVSQQKTVSECISHPKENILCKMIEKYGIYRNNKFSHKQIPEHITDTICTTLKQSIASIKERPTAQSKAELDKLVDDIKGLPYKHFLSGLLKFLKQPARKTELFNKITTPPAPPMSKSEQILLYLISQVKTSWAPVDIVDEIMSNIEFSIFRLGQAPDFDVIESLSHFYAVLCRFSKAKNRLRLFILDAMYCLTYKAIPLIKTCIDVWMHVLPLSHMGMAKSPLVICIVYLLHYYKCEDSFKRVQEIRFLLKKRYSFEMTEWNESRMLDLLKNSILQLRDIPTEKKMLRIALIIIAKRQGPKWCQNNLLKRILLPLIDKEDLPERVKEFGVSMLGPLMKPYPNDMKVHCEIVLNQLFDMLELSSSQRLQEAIFTSLLYIQRHDPYRVTQALLSWKAQGEVSRHLEDMLREFVREKPIKVWTRILAKYALG